MVDLLASRRALRRGAPVLSLAARLLLGVALAAAAAPPPLAAQTPKKSTPAPSLPGNSSGEPSSGVTVMGMGRFLVGDAAPDVNLNDQDGRAFRLAEARQKKPWLLVFVRRPKDVVEAEAAALDLATLGMGTAVIAPFGRDRVREWVRAPRLPMLFDRASVTARTFGVYDPVTTNPRPGAFLIDQRGRIVWLISGGLPSAPELVRMTGEALEAQREEMGSAAGRGPAK